MKFANFLENQQQNLVAYGNELPTLLNRVLNYNNVIVSHYYYIYLFYFSYNNLKCLIGRKTKKYSTPDTNQSINKNELY